MKSFRVFIALALLVLTANLSSAADIPPDSRVKDALDRLKLSNTTNADGTFQVIFKVAGDRSQVVFVNSKTQTYYGTEYRDVTSTALEVEGDLEPEQARSLLADNDKRGLGSWRTVKRDDKTYVIYGIQVPVDIPDNRLAAVMAVARDAADQFEKDNSDLDIY